MIKTLIENWNNRKGIIEEILKNTPQDRFSYKYFAELICDKLLDFKEVKVHEIDDGHYQGTLIFIMVDGDIYQPSASDYYKTYVEYGSCSGCDTLEAIRRYKDDCPKDEEVKEYMTLILHMVQRTSKLIEI